MNQTRETLNVLLKLTRPATGSTNPFTIIEIAYPNILDTIDVSYKFPKFTAPTALKHIYCPWKERHHEFPLAPFGLLGHYEDFNCFCTCGAFVTLPPIIHNEVKASKKYEAFFWVVERHGLSFEAIADWFKKNLLNPYLNVLQNRLSQLQEKHKIDIRTEIIYPFI